MRRVVNLNLRNRRRTSSSEFPDDPQTLMKRGLVLLLFTVSSVCSALTSGDLADLGYERIGTRHELRRSQSALRSVGSEHRSLLVSSDGAVYLDSGSRRSESPAELCSEPQALPSRRLLTDDTQGTKEELEDRQSCLYCLPGDSFEVSDPLQRPFAAVGRLRGETTGNIAVVNCTGTLIGRRHVLTAAHCIFDNAITHQYNANLSFSGTQKGSSTQLGASKDWLYARVPASFATQGNQTLSGLNSAVALITLPESASANFWLNISSPLQAGQSSNIRLMSAGYPVAGDGALYTANCTNVTLPDSSGNMPYFTNVSSCGSNACSNLFLHNCDVTAGQSGSAMWDETQTVKAIMLGKVFTQPDGKQSHLGLVLSSGIQSLIQSWYDEDSHDLPGSLSAETAAADVPIESAGHARRPWIIAFGVETGVFAVILLALLALLVSWWRQRQELQGQEESPKRDISGKDGVEKIVVASPKAEPRFRAGPDLVDSGTFLVGGELRPVWEEAGVLDYSYGDRYAGELRHERPSGFGVAEYASAEKEVYSGQWIHGRQHGWGVLTHSTDRQIAGQWVDGSLVFATRYSPQESTEIGDEHAEAIDLCEEAARMAYAAAASAEVSGSHKQCEGRLFPRSQ